MVGPTLPFRCHLTCFSALASGKPPSLWLWPSWTGTISSHIGARARRLVVGIAASRSLEPHWCFDTRGHAAVSRPANDASRSRSRGSIASAVNAAHGRPGRSSPSLIEPGVSNASTTQRSPLPRTKHGPVAERPWSLDVSTGSGPGTTSPRSRSGRRSRAPPRRARPRAPARWRGSHRVRQRATRRHAGKPPRAPSFPRGRRPPTACNLCARARTTAGHGSSSLHCRCGLFEPVVAPEELVADRDGRDAAHAALVCLACRLP